MEQEQPADKTLPLASSLTREASAFQTTPERLVALGGFLELRPLVAANAGTPSTYLAELSKDESAQVREAVAQNPNTPLDCLLRLAREFPAAFLHNPLLPLLDLTQPEWYTQIEDLTWLFLLKSEELPRRWLDWMAARKRSKGPAYHRVSDPVGDPYGVWVAVRLRVDMPELHANGEHIGRALAEGIALVAQHQRTPAPLLIELATIQCQYNGVMEIGAAVCEQVRRDVAQNVAAPEHILRQLALDKDQKVRYRVGRNPQTPVDLLERLADDPVAYVRSGVAANPSVSAKLLERLALDTMYEEQYERAQQQIVPKARLHDVRRMKAQEALNNVKLVKGALAGNPATPISVLERLASHSEYEVREHLAANPIVPASVLLRLAGDVESILWTLVEKNPRMPAEALIRLASHENSRVRIGVAAHPNTPTEVLARLAHDTQVRVREAVAQNSRTPAPTLEMLLEHGEAIEGTDTVVRVALARNPSAPRDILTRLASKQTRTITSALAKNPHLPVELIDQLLEHEDEEVRKQIANHPNVSQAHLERLAQDTQAQIQRIAQRRLDRWHALGQRGQVRYLYQGNLDEAENTPLSTVGGSMPFYEMQRHAQALNPLELRAFLTHFQLPAETRSELFTLLLPVWSQKWKEHIRYIDFCSDLLTDLEISPAWQRVFANSPLWQERYIMALKPGIETALLEQLANDSNRYVRAAARWYVQQRCESSSE